MEFSEDGVKAGSSVCLNDLLDYLKNKELRANSTLDALREHLSHIGNTHLRNTISVGGIVAVNEGIGDFVPFLRATVDS